MRRVRIHGYIGFAVFAVTLFVLAYAASPEIATAFAAGVTLALVFAAHLVRTGHRSKK